MKRLLSVLGLVLSLSAGAAFADMDVEIDINWVAPTHNTDGSLVDDLAGFYVYYGRASGAYDAQYEIPNPLQTSDTFSVLNVLNGESIYVVMTAYDAAGNVSAYSNEVRFGPFVETDTVSPSAPGPLSGAARVVRCGTGRTCSAP